MERPRLAAVAVCFLLSAVESQPFTISVEHSLINATVGHPVLLSVRPSEEVRSGGWKHNEQDVALWIGTTPDIHNNYNGRVELLFPNASLLLKSVSFSDSGEYIVTMNSVSNTRTARIDLRVYEPISSAYITSNVSNPVQENDSVCLKCNVIGNCTRRVWSLNGCIIQANKRIILSSGNVTLTIIDFNRTDSGEYRCAARSPVSEITSELYLLEIGGCLQSNIETYTIIVAVLGVALFVALFTIGILAFKMWRMARKEMSEMYTLATVSGTLSTMPTYETCLPSVNAENECKNQDRSESNYMALQFRNESVYDQLKRV